MKKKFLFLVSALLLCMSNIMAQAASSTCGDNLTWRLTTDGELIIEGTGAMYDYENGAAPWYEYRDEIKTLTIKEGVTTVGNWAFTSLKNMSSISIPGTVSSLGTETFKSCNSLVSVTLPVGLKTIGWASFFGCGQLSSIEFPEGLETIGNYAFGDCGRISSLTFPESLTQIGMYAFSNCGPSYIMCKSATPPAMLSGYDGDPFPNKSMPLYVPVNSIAEYQVAYLWKGFNTIQPMGTCGNNLTWRLTTEGELIIEGTGAMYDYENGTAPWYGYKDEIKTLTIKEGVTTVGNWAFTSLKNMSSISIPGTVSSLGTETFKSCNSLVSVTLPVGLKTIGWGSFYECSQLSSIEFPEGLETIGNYAFGDCGRISSLTFPESLTQIGMYAFRNCGPSYIICKAATPPSMLSGYDGDPFPNKSMPLYIPVNSIDEYQVAYLWKGFTNIQPMIIASGSCGENLTWRYHEGGKLVVEGTGEMYDYANETSIPWYNYRRSINSVEIKDGVTSISNWAFTYCSTLTDVAISESVTTIGKSAFRGCSILEEITLPTGLTQLGAEVFYECLNLETVTLPEGLSSIETSTFYHCRSLQSVVIPKSVTSLEWGVFFGCENLTSVTCNATTPPLCIDTSFFAFDVTKCTLYVPDESVSAYQQANYWKNFIRPLASGTCGENLTWKLTYEGELIVEGTGDMTSAPWGEYKESINTITVCEGVTSIYWEAFRGCRCSTVSLPNTLISIGYQVFNGCPLTSIVFPQSLKSVDRRVFCDCGLLSSVTLNEGLESLASETFRACGSLTSIEIPASMKTIAGTAFYECTNLASVIINEGVQVIGSGAFCFCYNIASLTLPASITEIGNDAFRQCVKLSYIISNPTTPPTIESGSDAFNEVDKSIPLYVPAASVEAYKAANGWSDFTNIQPMGTCGDNLTWKLTPEGELIIEGTGKMYNYGYYYGIDVPWIDYRQSIKKITIEEGVTSISEFAFESCDKVVSVVVPASIESIGWGAFYYCSGELIVNGFPTSGDSMMGGGFSESSFTKVTIADGITEIPDYSFEYCMNLTSIVIPESVTKIGSGAFEMCHSLSEITLPSNVQTIGAWAFEYCSSLSKLTCKATTAPICNPSAFAGMNSNTAVYVPLEAIESYTNADGWKNLQNIAGVAACGENLTAELTLKGYLNIVGTGEMSSIPWEDNKEIIKTITIADGITSIADGAFDNCDNLVEIFSYAVNPPTCSDQFEGVDKNTPVYVDEVNAYRTADGWKEFTYITPQNTKILFDSYEKFTQAADENFATITYIREFNNTEWQALYVPFEIPVTEEFLTEFEVADLNDIRQYDRDDDSVADETVVEAFKVTNGVLKANYPYLIRAKETGEKNIIVTDATLYATEENSIDCSSVHEKYTFTSTYSTIAASALTGCYALSNGVWQPIADDASLGAFRFYLSIESRNGNMQAARNIIMHVIGKDTGNNTTSIENIYESGDQDSEVIYDLQGHRVTKPENGIYIINGKKVFIK